MDLRANWSDPGRPLGLELLRRRREGNLRRTLGEGGAMGEIGEIVAMGESSSSYALSST